MASVTTTYGKKRSLLKSIGSRRRQKHLADSISAKKQSISTLVSSEVFESNNLLGPRSNSSRPPQHESKHTTRTSKNSLSDAIEAMASALLDDTSQPPFCTSDDNALVTQDMPSKITSPSISHRSEHEMVNSGFGMAGIGSQHGDNGCLGQRASRTQKHLPNGTRALARAASTRPVASISADWEHATPRRPLSHLNRRTLQTSGTNGLKKSCSVPFTTTDTTKGSNTNQNTGKLRPSGSDVDDIEKKVTAMLAATDALKPFGTRVLDTQTSRKSHNVGSKVFEKVSNYVWDRLASKPVETDSRDYTGPRSPHVHTNGDWHEKHENKDCPNGANVISTIEIRLNEGDNLNRNKVRQIVGGQVTRKPVADDGRSLRNGRTVDDPFAVIAPAAKLHEPPGPSLEAIPLIPEEYFQSEIGFDDDLDDGILSTVPVGSSTPKSRHGRLSSSSWDISHANESAEPIGSPQVAVRLALAKPSGCFEVQEMKSTTAKSREKRLLEMEGQYCFNPATISQDPFIKDFKRVKKHPSPSKRDLEDLEMAMQRYTIFKTSVKGGNELDELAKTCEGPSGYLAPRDRNMLMSNSQAAPSSVPLHNLQAPQLSYCHAATRQIKPAGLRLAVPYRPPMSCSDDIDELH